jgi:hypothetical protein
MNNLPCNIDDVRKDGVYFHSFSNWLSHICLCLADGLNLEDIKGDVERLIDKRDKIPEITENGRTWALENYSPLATARRFLGYVTYN